MHKVATIKNDYRERGAVKTALRDGMVGGYRLMRTTNAEVEETIERVKNAGSGVVVIYIIDHEVKGVEVK